MPNPDSLADLTARMRIVEHAIIRFESQLEHSKETHEHTGGIVANVIMRLCSLEESRAKLVGLAFGVGFLGAGTGGGIAWAGFKLLGH